MTNQIILKSESLLRKSYRLIRAFTNGICMPENAVSYNMVPIQTVKTQHILFTNQFRAFVVHNLDCADFKNCLGRDSYYAG